MQHRPIGVGRQGLADVFLVRSTCRSSRLPPRGSISGSSRRYTMVHSRRAPSSQRKRAHTRRTRAAQRRRASSNDGRGRAFMGRLSHGPSLQGGESAQARASGVGRVCGMRSGACPHTPRTLRTQGRHHWQWGRHLHLLHQRELVTKINTPESKFRFRELTEASFLDPLAISWRP
jgi:hypothetical protein